MAPRRTTLSGKSEHRSRSISPLLRTDTRDNEQHTNPPPFPRGRVIPDSQEDPSDFDLSADDTEEAELEPEQAITGTKNQYSSFDTVDTVEEDFEAQRALAGVNDQQESFNTVDTVLIPGGTKLSPRPEPRNSLRKQGINCNGRLAVEHPDFEDMEEEATQPSTQPRFDPRRHGDTSMVSLDDEADVVCILHPTTPAAYRAAEMIAKYCPQHILQNQGLSRNLDYDEVEDIPTTRSNDPDDEHYTECTQMAGKHQAEIPEFSSRDIALRFSSTVHNVCLGWSFGRTPARCDLPIVGVNETLKISNMHFRIYLNQSGVLMLEDTSTNGTWVDKVHLQTRNMPAGKLPRRTIQAGSIIEILLSSPDSCMRFVISVPPRDRAEAKYNQRLREYLAQVKQLEHQHAVADQAAANGNPMAPPAVLPFGHVHRTASHVAPSVVAPHSSYNHGMTWNGGETYNVVAHIGKGAFANVYKLATKQDGELFAAKEIEKRRFIKDGILSGKAHNEIDVMKQLDHPNIIKYIGYTEMPKHIYIIMEYIPCGDLTQYINSASVMPEYMCRYVAHQMMKALDYLHKQKITHRDIKPDNILIASNDPFVVKLSDFGLSKVISHDNTFLKTFCGTLLYCAPEVYPGYEKVKAGLPQKRQREPDEKKLPYKQSADTWAFAAVLFHLMCGKPPYTGSSDDRGALMLDNVMHNDVDFERLTRAGVSREGVDFVEKMLVHEPSQRATDAECLRHPWIVDLSIADAADVEMEAPLEDPPLFGDGQELDASQLSLNDPPDQVEIDDSEEGEVLDVDELEQLHRSKRTRTDSPRAMGFRPEEASSSGESYNTIPTMIVPATNREAVRPTPDRAQERLYGEIGTSALRSSGVLGQDAHAALDMSMEGSRDESVSVSDTSPMNYATESHVTNDGISQHSLQYPQILPGPAPSLLGTEALVDQLNMASPESGPSVPSVDSKSGTPHTPRSRELSPSASAIAGSKRSSQELQTNPEHTASKRAKSHRSNTPSQPHRQSGDAPTPQHASRASGRDSVNTSQSQRHASVPKSQTRHTAAGQGTGENKGQHSGETGKGERKATTASNSEGPREQATAVPGSHAVMQRKDGSSSGTNSASTSTVQDTPVPAPEFPLPAPILGRLNTVPGSVIDVAHFNLTTRLTYYGRFEEKKKQNLGEGEIDIPFTSYVYPHNLDNRVPKNALDVVFWRPGIEADEKKGVDWIQSDDFWAILMTRTSACVWVNGVKLTRGTGHTRYGKLYTGDIITIFGPKEGESAQGKAAEYLKFECEFFYGLSKQHRPDGPRFTIETEVTKYQENQARKSREGSMVASTTGAGTGTSTSPAP